jgi:hypothetical protein
MLGRLGASSIKTAVRLNDVDGRDKPRDKPGDDAGAADDASPFHPRGPAAGRYELAMMDRALVF